MPMSVRFGRAGADSGWKRTVGVPEIATIGYTLSMWVKVNTVRAALQCLATIEDAAPNNWGIYIASGGTHYGINNNSAQVNGTATITTGVWDWLVFRCVAGTNGLVLYVNGVADVTTTGFGAWTPTDLTWGTDKSGTRWSQYNAAKIKVWNRILTLQEMIVEQPYAMPVNWGGLNSCYAMPTADDVAMLRDVRQSALTRWTDFSGNNWEQPETGTLDLEPGPPGQFMPENLRAPRRVYRVPTAAGAAPWRPYIVRQAVSRAANI